MRLLVLVAIAACSSPTAQRTQPTFECRGSSAEARIYVPGASTLLVGDFDGDASPDVVLTYPTTNEIEVRLADRVRGFERPLPRVAIGARPHEGLSADVNGDGKLDIVLGYTRFGTDGPLDSGLAVLLGRGDGTFDPGGLTPLATNGDVGRLGVVDINTDGSPDLVASIYAGDTTILVLVNNGAGEFTTAAMLPPADGADQRSPAFATGDLDRNGFPDLVTAVQQSDPSSNSVCVYLNQGGSTFAPSCFESSTGIFAGDMVVDDFDGDGNHDLAASGWSSLVVFAGRGDGSFGPGLSYPVRASGTLRAAHFTNDDKPDLMTLRGDGIVELWPNDGTGAFLASMIYSVGRTGTGSSVLADVDGDAINDLAMVSGGLDGSDGNEYLDILFGVGSGKQWGMSPPNAHLLEESPVGAVVGDVDGDGIIDVVVPNEGPVPCDPAESQLVVLFGTVSGAYEELVIPLGPGCAATAPVTIGDVTGDGVIDIVFADTISHGSIGTSGPAGIRVLVGQGNRTFGLASVSDAPIDSNPTLADFDGDGQLDIAFSSGMTTFPTTFHPGISISLSQEGSFGAPVFHEVGTARAIATGDIDKDGITDVVLAQEENVRVLRGQGDGSFNASAILLPTGRTPVAVAMAHLEDAEALDIVTVNEGDSTISVIRGHADGSFDAAVSYPVGSGPTALAIGDVTGDDRPDILVATSTSGELTIFENKPGATFDTTATMPAGQIPIGIVLEDVNGDGRDELVIADLRRQTITVRDVTCEYVERPTD